MYVDDIKSDILGRSLLFKPAIEGVVPATPEQLRRLSPVIQDALRGRLVPITVKGNADSSRMAVLSFLLGREITTSKELSWELAKTLIDRWQGPEWKANQLAKHECAYLRDAWLELVKGQTTMAMDEEQAQSNLAHQAELDAAAAYAAEQAALESQSIMEQEAEGRARFYSEQGDPGDQGYGYSEGK